MFCFQRGIVIGLSIYVIINVSIKNVMKNVLKKIKLIQTKLKIFFIRAKNTKYLIIIKIYGTK